MPISIQDLATAAPATAAPATAAPATAAPATAAPATAAPATGPNSGTPSPGTLQEPLVPKDESKAQIPDAVLQLPTFRAILQGAPPAISTKGAETDPDLNVLKGNVEPLLYSGFGFYQAKDGKTQVIYNSKFVDGNTLKIADDKGKLDAVATPYGELKSFFTAGLSDEAGATTAEPPAVAPQPITPAAAAPAQSKLATARLASAAPGAPSSGPVPGQGRVLSQILKPAV